MWCLYLRPLFTAQTAWQHVNQTTPQRPSCREFQTTQPTIHLPSSYGLTNPTSFFCILLLKDTTICVATSVPDPRMRLSEGRSMCMINRSKPGHSLQDFRLSQRYCFKIQVFSVVTLCQNFEGLCQGAKQFYIPSTDSARTYSTDISVDGRKVFNLMEVTRSMCLKQILKIIK